MMHIPLTLHDALTHSKCTVCGSQLKWNLVFNNDLNQPTYTTMHCNLEYETIIHTVRIKVLKSLQQPGEQEIVSNGGKKVNKEYQKQQKKTQLECEPRAILMAKALKEKRKEEETKSKDKADEEATVIEELESQGDLKEDVPLGGEEYEDEEPRQG
jgi:hypothetical protein